MYYTKCSERKCLHKIKDKICHEEAVKVCPIQIKMIVFKRLLITFAVHVVANLIKKCSFYFPKFDFGIYLIVHKLKVRSYLRYIRKTLF